MEFCPSCGTRLILTRNEGNAILSCTKCNYQKRSDSTLPKKKNNKNLMEGITIIGKEDKKLRTMPTAKVECSKCGNKLAYTWQVQTRSADEGSTQFFRCTKCDNTFRLYT